MAEKVYEFLIMKVHQKITDFSIIIEVYYTLFNLLPDPHRHLVLAAQ